MRFTHVGALSVMLLYSPGWQPLQIAAAASMFNVNSSVDETCLFPELIRLHLIRSSFYSIVFDFAWSFCGHVYVCVENCLLPGGDDCIYWILFDSIMFDPNRIVEFCWVPFPFPKGFDSMLLYLILFALFELIRIDSMLLDFIRFSRIETDSGVFHSIGFVSSDTLCIGVDFIPMRFLVDQI